MSFDIRHALAGGGAAVALVVAAAGFGAGDAINPNVADKATEPLIAVFAPAEPSPCPSGWEYEPAKDEHTIVEACDRGGWRVILNAEGGFSHGWQPDTPGSRFVFNPEEVPGWLR